MPNTTTSVLGMRIAHRMMRTDLVRLQAAAGGIATGRTTCPDRRAAAIARWVRLLCTEIVHHHEVEDATAWPVIAAHAGAQVDLAVLTDDHEALDPMLDAMRAGADGLVAAREDQRARAAERLAAALAVLHDHLSEHLAAEEESVFPVIEHYVPAAEWARVEQAAKRGGPRLSFTVPRALDVTSNAERAELMDQSPAMECLLMSAVARILTPPHRRRERLVFGTRWSRR